MPYLIVFAILILLFQIALFVYLRKKNRKFRETDVLLKYNIKSRKDAWNALGDHSIPEKDRERIRELYEAGDE